MSQNPAGLLVKTIRVIVFKDGYCMFIKKASGTADSNSIATINHIPEAMVLGSFWVIPKTGKLVNIITKQYTVSRKARQETDKYMLLKFNAEMADKDVEIIFNYFGPGIRWIPTYRISIEDKDKCHLMMQAEVLNEAENLDDVPMDLVVGVPNFRFKDVVSPISLETNLFNPLEQIAPQLESQALGNVFRAQERGRSFGGPVPSPSGMPTLPSELTGEGSQDLFIYKIPKIKMNMGERAVIPLINTEHPFRHLYTWDVHIRSSNINVLPKEGSRLSPITLTRNEIWHQIELINQTDAPWTTGAALIMEKYLPLSQELLTYTSIGGKVLIPLSIAVDVRGNYTQEEIARDVKAIHFDGYDYAKVTKKGTLKISNYKNEIVDLMVTCELGGNATEGSHDGQITISDFQNNDWTDFRGAQALTGHSTIQWTLQFAPKETREVTFKYHYFIR